MKRLVFFAAATLIALAGCSKQEEGLGPEISFQVARYSQTKANPDPCITGEHIDNLIRSHT